VPGKVNKTALIAAVNAPADLFAGWARDSLCGAFSVHNYRVANQTDLTADQYWSE
jgi:hypothetical protein